MLVSIQTRPPIFASVIRNVDAAAFAVLAFLHGPRGQIQSQRIFVIYCQAIRRIAPLGKRDGLPVFLSISGTIECAIAFGADFSFFRSACDQHVERATAIANNSPCKRLLLRDAGIF